MPKPQYFQKFRESWLKDPELSSWIIKVESTHGPVVKCKWCSCTLANKYSDLKSHATTNKHKRNLKLLVGTEQPKLNLISVNEIDGARITEYRLALYIANHTPISTIDHFVSLCKNCFHGNESTYLQMHRTKCSAIIKYILGPHFQNELLMDIGDRGFSILIDESTDISVHKYLGCSIIYYSEKQEKVISTFLDLSELESADADGIFNCLVQIMTKHKLKLENLLGIGTDNASVMTGINNGVVAKLKQYNPNLILNRCVCHSIQLAASAASKELPRNLEFLIRETYDWFARSASRQLTYKLLYNTINNGLDPLKITQSCSTRWLSLASAVSRIYEQWLELKTHFTVVHRNGEKCYSAYLLHQMFEDDYNYAYICFLKPILEEVNRVNKNFESQSADPTKLLNDLITLLESIIKKITTPNSAFTLFVHNIDDYIDFNCYMGYLFEIQVKKIKEAGFKEEKNLRERCVKFLVTLIKELINRLPDNIDILRQMSLFSVQSVLRHFKPDITSILVFFHIKENEIATIQNQWSAINLVKWQIVEDTNGFWSEVLKYKDSNGVTIFKELADVAINILSLPHSNAEVEHLFSQMNLIKNKTRNRMKIEMLSSILRVRAGLKREGKCCFNYTVPHNVLQKIKTIKSYSYTEDESDDINQPQVGKCQEWDIFSSIC